MKLLTHIQRYSCLHWVGVCLVVAAVISTGWRLASRDTSWSRIQQSNTIRIGYAVEAPYAFATERGEVTGESVVVAQEMARTLGVQRVVWVQTTFDSLIPDLNAGRFDVIAAGMFITPERMQRVHFSHPTFCVGPGLLVRRDDPPHLRVVADVADHAEIRVAVIAGAIEEAELLNKGVAREQLVLVPDAVSGRAAVTSGFADALLLSAPTVRWLAKSDPDQETQTVVPFQLGPQNSVYPARGAFVFRQSDRALQAVWNTALGQFLGTPQHRQIVANFGFEESELSHGIALAETSP